MIARLPPWVRLVLLTREDPQILNKLQPLTPSIVLDRFEQENRRDIRAFLEAALDPQAPAPAVRRKSITTATGTATATPGSSVPATRPRLTPENLDFIAARSEGLFLYAVNIVQAIDEGRLALDQLASLPLGIGGYLRQFFDSHFEPQHYKDKIRPVLEVLCAAFEPLPLQALGAILHWSAYEQHEVAASFGSLFYVTEGDGFMRPFHSSVLDWVQDGKSAGPFYAEAAHGHARIGQWAFREYETVVKSKSNVFVNLKSVNMPPLSPP